MSIPERTAQQLRAVGSEKWTGITARDGSPTVGAWVAEMDFGTAPAVAQALHHAIDAGFTGYRPPWIEAELARVTAAYQREHFGWSIDPGDVVLAEAVLPALRTTIAHLTRPGSPVVVPTPSYMPFLTIPAEFGREVIQVPSLHRAARGASRGAAATWSLDLAGIRAGLERGAGLVLLCNPWNPTGRVLSVAELRALNEVVRGYDALVFADEIHAPLVLDPDVRFRSYASLGPEFAARTVTAIAASKGWNIAGLPCAQVILPDSRLRERWEPWRAGTAHGATAFGALGAIAAYTKGWSWLEEVRSYLRANLDAADRALEGTGIDYTRPQATYLTWWGCGELGFRSESGPSPARVLRERAHVATNDGRSLGSAYRTWLRFNVATPRPVLEEALSRSVEALRAASTR